MWKELKAFWKSDSLLNNAWSLSYEAINIDREMFTDAVDALRKEDKTATQKLIFKKDKQVNKYEREIRRNILTHLAVQGPANLSAGLVLSTIIVDIERIGDYVKNIVDLVELHPGTLDAGKHEKEITEIEKGLKYIINNLQEYLEVSDEEKALQIYTEYKWINVSCDKIIRLLITEPEKEIKKGTIAVLVLYTRYLKRINAHLRNIISSIINPYDRIGYKPKKKK